MSKRRKTGIMVLLLLPAVFFVWLDHYPNKRRQQYQGKSEEQASAYDLERYDAQTFTVTNVIDGDTIDIDIADGKYEHTRVRLWGIDTPETKSEQFGVMYFGPQAAQFTAKLTLGKPVTVYLDNENRTRGKYGRLLAYVKLPDDRFLNEVLLTEGLAYADLRFSHDFYSKYKQLQARARSRRKGLWEKVTREQLPQWLQKMNPELLLNK